MTSHRYAVRRAVAATLTVAVMILISTLLSDNGQALPWHWVQENAHSFYVLKGLLSGVAVVLVIAHMHQVWAESMELGQRLRYVGLFYLTALIAAASVEQANQHVAVNSRNIGALLGAVLVIIAMIVSMRDARSRR